MVVFSYKGNIYIYIYIYIEREREREREMVLKKRKKKKKKKKKKKQQTSKRVGTLKELMRRPCMVKRSKNLRGSPSIGDSFLSPLFSKYLFTASNSILNPILSELNWKR